MQPGLGLHEASVFHTVLCRLARLFLPSLSLALCIVALGKLAGSYCEVRFDWTPASQEI